MNKFKDIGDSAGTNRICGNTKDVLTPSLVPAVLHYPFEMELKEALETLFKSQQFYDLAKLKNKRGSTLRAAKSRYERGILGVKSALSLLEDFGYTYTIQKPKEIKPKK